MITREHRERTIYTVGKSTLTLRFRENLVIRLRR